MFEMCVMHVSKPLQYTPRLSDASQTKQKLYVQDQILSTLCDLALYLIHQKHKEFYSMQHGFGDYTTLSACYDKSSHWQHKVFVSQHGRTACKVPLL